MFQNRREAGRLLGEELQKRHLQRPVVLGLPRGGVPVADEVARVLGAPLDIIVARKLGAPLSPELAMGAVVDGDKPEVVLNPEVVRAFGVSRDDINAQVTRELEEIRRRQAAYREGRPPAPVEGRTAVLVDDGIATGASTRAAIRGVRRKSPERVILAVPVAPASAQAELGREVDDFVCLDMPEPFVAVGIHYENFYQVPDEEVIEVLRRAWERVEQAAKSR